MASVRWWSACYLLCVCCTEFIRVSSALPIPINKTLTSQLAAIHTGVQVLLPGCQFTQNATVTHISMKVRGPNTPISFQVWRPVEDKNYELHWYVTSTDNSLMTRHRDEVRFEDERGFLVGAGDILGVHVLPSDDPISVVYYEGERFADQEVMYVEGVDYPYCHLAFCNDSVRVVTGVSPSINMQMTTGEDLTDSSEEEDQKSNIECAKNSPISCTNPIISYDDPPPGNSAPNPPEDTTHPSPRDLPNTTQISSKSTPEKEQESTTAVVSAPSNGHSILPRNMNSSGLGDTGGEDPTDDGGGLILSTAAVVFIAIGAVFFVVLVILIIVLCICLCPRNSERKTFVPTAPPASGSSYRANLVVSSSVEQSNSSCNSEPQRPGQHTVHLNRLPTDHTYANAEVSQVGDFRPFTPIYMNSDDDSMKEMLPERSSHHGSRSREGRGWSVGSTHGDRIHRHQGSGFPVSTSHSDRICAHQTRDGRGWSAGPSQLSKVQLPREGRGSSVDPALLDRVHRQPDRERRGWSVGNDDRIQNTRGASVGPSSVDRTDNQQSTKKKRGWSLGHKDKVRPSREERALPATPPHESETAKLNFQAMQHKRAGRAKSVSATTKFKIDHTATELPRPRSYSSNLSSVLSKPLPLPPFSVPPPAPLLRRSNPQLNARLLPPPTHTPPPPMETLAAPSNDNRMDTSGDYSSPVPVSERYKYDPKLRQDQVEAVSMQGQPFIVSRSHDYSDPDDPDDEMDGEMGYDHLTPPEIEVHPERHSQALAELEGLKDEPEQVYAQGYVPSEEQRRMIQLHYGGHYEIDDDIDTKLADGYDHLNFFKESDAYWAPAATAEDLYTQLSEYKYREIPRKEISILNSIGSGHFGTVRKGVWFNESPPINVAIKTVKNSTEQERVKLLQEAAIMGQFAHSYVVRLLGVVTVGEPVLVILEYMQKGDLHSFLQKLHPKASNRDLPDIIPKLFVKFSKDIANGMSYLAKKCFIHRDLAARNILLNDELTCKIGDFGMARDIESEGDYYKSRGGIIPVKWTAPEALHYNKYSSASDVWSYGMVMFEIWSLGEKPFSELSNPIVIALVSSKHCQPPPPGCPRPVYHLMVECWNPDHAQRPTFDSIYDYLDSPEDSLLQWQDRDVIQDKLAHVLGAPLEEANNLYLDLQRTYQKPLIN